MSKTHTMKEIFMLTSTYGSKDIARIRVNEILTDGWRPLGAGEDRPDVTDMTFAEFRKTVQGRPGGITRGVCFMIEFSDAYDDFPVRATDYSMGELDRMAWDAPRIEDLEGMLDFGRGKAEFVNEVARVFRMKAHYFRDEPAHRVADEVKRAIFIDRWCKSAEILKESAQKIADIWDETLWR